MEKQLKDVEGKLPKDQKAAIEKPLNELKAAHAAKDIAKIDVATEALNKALQAAGQQQANASGADKTAQKEASKDDSVEDVDFEEVK